jgi:superfamily II DNA or RNA helicase
VKLRPYQEEALAALESDWAAGLRRCGISSATGTGKTVMMAHLAHRYAPGRVLILVHRDELVRQTVDKLVRVDNSVSVGVVKAHENSAWASIVVASVQTVCRPKRLAQLGRFSLIICDEAHRSVADQWLSVLRGLGALDEGTEVRTAGFSATWSRADSRKLGDLWEKISFELPIDWAIEQGFLVRPRGLFIRTGVELDGIRQTAGDYDARDLGDRLSRESVREAIVAGYLTHAVDRSGVVFAPTVAAGEYFRAGFEGAGITTGGLYGTTSREDSKRLHKLHRAGDVQLLVSCVKLSEGWDAPWCSAGVIARPTTHEGLFAQMVGRLIRVHCERHPGDACACPDRKRDAVILDPTGVLFRHSLNGVIDLSHSAPKDPVDDDDDEREFEPREPVESAADEGIRARVTGYEVIDLVRSELPYLATHGGILFSHERSPADAVRFVVGPGQHEYPWWSVGRWPLSGSERPAWIAVQLPDEQSALRYLLDRRTVPGTSLRRRPATAKQRRMAESTGASVRRGQTCGEVFDAMRIELASRALDSVRSWT